jgi:cytoskeletal protein RodZ
MSEHWNLEAVADSKIEAPPEKPAGNPSEDVTPAIPSVLSSDHSLGAIMTLAREARGFSRDQAAKASNIPAYYLTMIETDDYSSIADQLYLLPFLRRYAVFVALEPEEVASRFIRDVQRADMNPGRAPEPIAMFEPRRPFPWRIVMTTAWVVLVVAGGWFGYRYYEARKAVMANAKAPLSVAPAAPVVEQVVPQAAETAPANVAAPVPSTAIVPATTPSVAAAPAPMSSAAVVSPPVPQAAASPTKSKPTRHASARPRTPLKSASAAHRLSMEN